jgi:hypothetical protein
MKFPVTITEFWPSASNRDTARGLFPFWRPSENRRKEKA